MKKVNLYSVADINHYLEIISSKIDRAESGILTDADYLIGIERKTDNELYMRVWRDIEAATEEVKELRELYAKLLVLKHDTKCWFRYDNEVVCFMAVKLERDKDRLFS